MYFKILSQSCPGGSCLRRLFSSFCPRCRRRRRRDVFFSSFSSGHRSRGVFRNRVFSLFSLFFRLYGEKLRHKNEMMSSSECPVEETNTRSEKSDEIIANDDDENPATALWRLFREASLKGGACRDIVETHVICKLNATDLKFFYDVNTETRALIKRSSRAGDLKERFKMEEMSSISTLEFAWEHFPWGTTITYYDHVEGEDEVVELNEATFCNRVARTNKLELLKWVREEKKCDWNAATILAATIRNNMEMVKYCVANQCPIDADACSCAAEFGHLELLKYLREEVKAPWDVITLMRAQLFLNPVTRVPGVIVSQQLECLRYAVANRCPGWVSYASDIDIVNECRRYNEEGWPEPEQRTDEHYALIERIQALREALERV